MQLDLKNFVHEKQLYWFWWLRQILLERVTVLCDRFLALDIS
ncbi:MAG: hypothetical protein RMX68_014525 [Aulosira sp. ZfuVER01]|nr:hypothetical protein [Aulosira sp. ZfuCHP01]